ncbi:MAG: hypothetical protein QW728_04530, partial [Thermoplasmata archaeon]
LTDTPDTAGPYDVVATITDTDLNTSSLKVYYKKGSSSFTSGTMTPTGIANQYHFEIPGPASFGTTIYYYIEAKDLSGNTSLSPASANQSNLSTLYSFTIQQDTTPPTILHTPLSNTSSNNAYTVIATITDSSGVNTSAIYVGWNTNGSSTYYTVEPLVSTGVLNQYKATIPGQPAGTTVYYFIYAVDMASPPNTARAPASGYYSFNITSGPSILVVDDAVAAGRAAYYTYPLVQLGLSYDYIKSNSSDLAVQVSSHNIIIWFVSGYTSTVSNSEQSLLIDFLNNGGKLLICGEDIGYAIGTTDFYRLYLHANYIADDSNYNSIVGVSGDIIGDGITSASIYGNYPSIIAPRDSQASLIFTYPNGSGAALRAAAGNYKVVYFACEYFESADANNVTVMQRILQWFSGGFAADLEVLSINSPANGTTIPQGNNAVNVTIRNAGTQPQGPFYVNFSFYTLASAGTQGTLYSNNFETSSGTGTLSLGTYWSNSTQKPYSGTRSLWCGQATNSSWPAGNTAPGYGNNWNTTARLSGVSIPSNASNANLSFMSYFDAEPNWDYGYVYIIEGTNRTLVQTIYLGFTETPSWKKIEIDLTPWKGKTISINFTFVSDFSGSDEDGNYDGLGWCIDDISIKYAVDTTWTPAGYYNMTVSSTLSPQDTYSANYTYNFNQPAVQYKIQVYVYLANDMYAGNNMKTVYVNTSAVASPITLSNPAVSPASGTNLTLFNYTVTYRHTSGTAPSSARINIDGTLYSMQYVSGSNQTGALYRYSTTLGAGSHTYSFTFTAGEYTCSTAVFSGPSVSVNNPPTLTTPSVSPATGTTLTNFTFSVIYTDAENTAPVVRNLVLDGNGYPMNTTDNTYTDGSLFTLSLKLTAGSHTYYFNFSDGTYYTQTAQYSLSVSPNTLPVLSNHQLTPSSGNTSTIFNFTITATDADGDTMIVKAIIIDGVNRTMQGTGSTYWYATSLSAGTHEYYFLFSDGDTPVRYPASGSLTTPLVELPPPPPALNSPSVSPASGGTATPFTFSVLYSDGLGRAPSVHNLTINTQEYVMTTTGMDFVSGVLYTYTTTLPAGSYSYSFKFKVDSTLLTLGPYQGPVVDATNNPPQLAFAGHSPNTGTPETLIMFSVTYIDYDNDTPLMKRIYLDSTFFDMSFGGTGTPVYSAGAVFTFSRNFTEGTHTYYFQFSDGKAVVREPASGTYNFTIAKNAT